MAIDNIDHDAILLEYYLPQGCPELLPVLLSPSGRSDILDLGYVEPQAGKPASVYITCLGRAPNPTCVEICQLHSPKAKIVSIFPNDQEVMTITSKTENAFSGSNITP